MKSAIAKAPLAVGVDADSDDFYFYKSGIFDCTSNCGHHIDHATLIVGYGNDSG